MISSFSKRRVQALEEPEIGYLSRIIFKILHERSFRKNKGKVYLSRNKTEITK